MGVFLGSSKRAELGVLEVALKAGGIPIHRTLEDAEAECQMAIVEAPAKQDHLEWFDLGKLCLQLKQFGLTTFAIASSDDPQAEASLLTLDVVTLKAADAQLLGSAAMLTEIRHSQEDIKAITRKEQKAKLRRTKTKRFMQAFAAAGGMRDLIAKAKNAL